MAIQKTVEATVTQITIDTLRKISKTIYADQQTLQRLLTKWDDKILSDHLSATLKGHSNIYSIVLVNITGCLSYCEDILQNYEDGDTQYIAIQDTINYLSSLKDKGYVYLNIDGQHRVDSYISYLNDGFVIQESITNKFETDKGWVSEDIKGKFFSQLSEETQREILSYVLTVIVIKKGTLQDLVDVTIYTNIGEPWDNNERRIITPSAFNRQLHNYLSDNPLIQSMFKDMKKMDGAYSLKKKGDSLMLTEWQGHYHNVCEGRWYNWPDDSQLDRQSSVVGEANQSKSRIKEAYSIINKMANMVSNADSQHERTFYDNLIILLTILNKPNHPQNAFRKIIKIEDVGIKGFYDWFAKAEAKCREEDRYVLDSNGKIVVNPITNTKLTNSESFIRKCADKKVKAIQYRATKLMEKFNNSYNELFANGYITAIDSKNFSKNDKLRAAIESDWIDADGKVISYDELMGTNSIIEGDHIEARSKGGETNSENLTLRRKKANIRKSNKTI